MAETLALIPARGGSKGILKKNLRMLGGKPLLVWAIEAARNAGLQRIVVSTESPDIAAVANDHGASVLARPYELADDHTPMKAVITHALQHLEPTPQTIVLLQPTAPFRTPARIMECLTRLRSTGASCVMTLEEIPDHYNPEWAWRVLSDGTCERWHRYVPSPTRRQDLPRAYSRDGGCYAFDVESFLHCGDIYGQRTIAVVVPKDEACNLDTEADWQEAERRLKAQEILRGSNEHRAALRVLEAIEGVL